MNDQALIQAAKTDISAFTPLYEKYVKVLFRYCYYRSGRNKELAEDITSETFVKAIEKFHTFEYRKKPFVVWLYSIAHNLIIDHYRSKKERNVSLDAMLIPPMDDAEEIIDSLSQDEIQQTVSRHINKLPDELKNIFTLKHTEELTFAQIGNLIGKTEGAVKMQYYRGIETLKLFICQEQKSKILQP